MTVVLDSSAMVELLLGRTTAPGVARLLAGGAAVPAHFDAEVLGGLARPERLGLASIDRIEQAVADLVDAPVDRFELSPLLVESAWARRRNLSPADALYVALAAILEVPLVTTDRRLAAAPAPGVVITLVA